MRKPPEGAPLRWTEDGAQDGLSRLAGHLFKVPPPARLGPVRREQIAHRLDRKECEGCKERSSVPAHVGSGDSHQGTALYQNEAALRNSRGSAGPICRYCGPICRYCGPICRYCGPICPLPAA